MNMLNRSGTQNTAQGFFLWIYCRNLLTCFCTFQVAVGTSGGQIISLLAATAVLMLIIIVCFGFTIRTILSQRRFSELMVSFINNMTHEFKTPISTVALAVEAIKRPDVLEQKDKVLHFNEMIATENRRMRSQTDKILQMAALEEKDRELQLAEVDLHEVIRSAVDAVALHVENRKGRIICDLGARQHTLQADKVHLTNVVHNILDNANKYSPGTPQITVRTFDSSDGVGFRIQDQGMGLRPEDRKQVFDKYFRVSSGNRLRLSVLMRRQGWSARFIVLISPGRQ